MPHAIDRCPSPAASAHEFCEDFFVLCRKIACAADDPNDDANEEEAPA
jgi:hypothetical protein